jgi:hypothetical protein
MLLRKAIVASVISATFVLVPVKASACHIGPWDLRFAAGSSALSEEVRAQARHALMGLRFYEREGLIRQLNVTGFIHPNGRRGSDEKISSQRVRRVRAYLESLGVPRNRIYIATVAKAHSQVRALHDPRIATGPVSMIAFPEVIAEVRIELNRGCGSSTEL